MAIERNTFSIMTISLALMVLFSQTACNSSQLGPSGAANSPQAVAGEAPIDREHIEWCYKHRKNYRFSDNTYEGDDGKRYPCVSQR